MVRIERAFPSNFGTDTDLTIHRRRHHSREWDLVPIDPKRDLDHQRRTQWAAEARQGHGNGQETWSIRLTFSHK
jgi:hypothetical protein